MMTIITQTRPKDDTAIRDSGDARRSRWMPPYRRTELQSTSQRPANLENKLSMAATSGMPAVAQKQLYRAGKKGIAIEARNSLNKQPEPLIHREQAIQGATEATKQLAGGIARVSGSTRIASAISAYCYPKFDLDDNSTAQAIKTAATLKQCRRHLPTLRTYPSVRINKTPFCTQVVQDVRRRDKRLLELQRQRFSTEFGNRYVDELARDIDQLSVGKNIVAEAARCPGLQAQWRTGLTEVVEDIKREDLLVALIEEWRHEEVVRTERGRLVAQPEPLSLSTKTALLAVFVLAPPQDAQLELAPLARIGVVTTTLLARPEPFGATSRVKSFLKERYGYLSNYLWNNIFRPLSPQQSGPLSSSSKEQLRPAGQASEHSDPRVADKIFNVRAEECVQRDGKVIQRRSSRPNNGVCGIPKAAKRPRNVSPNVASQPFHLLDRGGSGSPTPLLLTSPGTAASAEGSAVFIASITIPLLVMLLLIGLLILWISKKLSGNTPHIAANAIDSESDIRNLDAAEESDRLVHLTPRRP